MAVAILNNDIAVVILKNDALLSLPITGGYAPVHTAACMVTGFSAHRGGPAG